VPGSLSLFFQLFDIFRFKPDLDVLFHFDYLLLGSSSSLFLAL
jgi:hypothetical protein